MRANDGVWKYPEKKEVFKDTVFMPSHSESEIEDCEGECSMFDLDEWEMIDLFVGN